MGGTSYTLPIITGNMKLVCFICAFGPLRLCVINAETQRPKDAKRLAIEQRRVKKN